MNHDLINPDVMYTIINEASEIHINTGFHLMQTLKKEHLTVHSFVGNTAWGGIYQHNQLIAVFEEIQPIFMSDGSL